MAADVLVQLHVFGQQGAERLILGRVGQLAPDQEHRRFDEVAPLGQLLDRNSAVAEDALFTVDEGDRALAGMREQRDRLLAETDFYALSDVTLSADMTTYRQNLRDLPAGKTTKADVDGATWPTKPAA